MDNETKTKGTLEGLKAALIEGIQSMDDVAWLVLFLRMSADVVSEDIRNGGKYE